MAVTALKPDPQPTVYSVEVRPAFVAALRKLAADGETTIEDMLAGWVEMTCMELHMGDETPATEEEMEAIREGVAQLDRGEGIPHEEVMARLKAKYGG